MDIDTEKEAKRAKRAKARPMPETNRTRPHFYIALLLAEIAGGRRERSGVAVHPTRTRRPRALLAEYPETETTERWASPRRTFSTSPRRTLAEPLKDPLGEPLKDPWRALEGPSASPCRALERTLGKPSKGPLPSPLKDPWRALEGPSASPCRALERTLGWETKNKAMFQSLRSRRRGVTRL